MESMLMDPIDDASVWTADRFRRADDWVFRFSETHLDELDAAVKAVRAAAIDTVRVRRDDFPLPTLGRELDAVRDELETGRGFALMRGIPVGRFGLDDLTTLYWGLGTYIGEGIFQNAQGDLVGRVTDHGFAFEGDDPYEHNIRAYTTTVEIPPHTDSCDIVGLLCVRPAKAGGGSAVASSTAIHNEFLRTRPDLLAPLYEGFHIDLIGKGTKAKELSRHRIPVFSYCGGKLSCRYNKGQIEHGARKADGGLTARQQEAVDHFLELARRPEFSLGMKLEAGDVQLLNNRVTLHARQAFEDDPRNPRLLLRLWLNSFTPRPMHPAFADQLNTGARGAVTVRT